MKKWLAAAAIAAFVSGTAQASLIGLAGTFVEGNNSFTYDGKLFQDGWAIGVYQSASSEINFDISLVALYQTTVSISTGVFPWENYVIISPISMNIANNAYIYPVLFDNADPGSSTSYLLLDTVAQNVGSYDPQVSYTPGHGIPSGTETQVAFSGQTWQAIPEPGTLGLLGLGAAAAFLRRRRR